MRFGARAHVRVLGRWWHGASEIHGVCTLPSILQGKVSDDLADSCLKLPSQKKLDPRVLKIVNLASPPTKFGFYQLDKILY